MCIEHAFAHPAYWNNFLNVSSGQDDTVIFDCSEVFPDMVSVIVLLGSLQLPWDKLTAQWGWRWEWYKNSLGFGNGLDTGMRERDESQRANTSALDDWVFNPDPSYPDEMDAGALKPRSQSTASRSMLTSKLSAKAGWDKLSLVFMTYRHPGQV